MWKKKNGRWRLAVSFLREHTQHNSTRGIRFNPMLKTKRNQTKPIRDYCRAWSLGNAMFLTLYPCFLSSQRQKGLQKD